MLGFEEIKSKKPLKQGIELGVEGENYIVSLDEERTYALSLSAYYVWQMCEGTKNVEELIHQISEELKASPEATLSEEELREPVTLILNQLAEVGLIKFVD
ncbi:MAG: hypothetical protein B7O98_02045 [Zestosphaera tikiterensis]|uniref:PqqD family protein n=1 Tax=Zestosphaera tikiterensis TaxID=1973259 RepID=A0A2R7Y7E7_9CREN|nr:MAG: hypothetical protein B7O98_02045 [Zestosphaera tikiterensis]